MKKYLARMKVTHPNGQPVFAEIKYFNGLASIRVRNLKDLSDDEIIRDGKITLQNIRKDDFKSAMEKLSNYLETKMLESMSKDEGEKDESRNTSYGNKSNSGRNEKLDTKRRSTKSSEQEGSTSSVHTGTRGNKPAEGSGEGTENAEVAESGDSPTGG